MLNQKRGIWGKPPKKNERLHQLEEKLPELLAGTRAPSTMLSYTQAFRRWKTWCEEVGVSHLPADHYDVCLFAIEKSETGVTMSTIENYMSAIALMHMVSGLEDPTKNVFLKQVLQSIKRGTCTNKEDKNVVSVNDLHLMVQNTDVENLKELRICTMMLLAFFSFMRINEVIHIKLEDLKFGEENLEINIPISKTDQFRKGQKVIVGKGNDNVCPLFFLKLYLAKVGNMKNEDYIFRPLQFVKDQDVRLKPTNRPMTYSNTRDEFKNLVKKAGLTQKKLKLHGLRSGGASAAANVGVPDRIIQKQGRWKTVSVKNDYIKENISKFSSITSEILSKR